MALKRKKKKTIEPFSFANLSPSNVSSLYLKPAAVFRCDNFFTLNASRSSVVQKVLSPEETFALQMIWLILSSYSIFCHKPLGVCTILLR